MPDLGVQTKVLDFYDDSDETSAAIHNQIVTKLEENGCSCSRMTRMVRATPLIYR